MSLLPLLFSAWWAELDRPHRLMDQHFGLGLYPEQLMTPRIDRYLPSIRDRAALELYYRPLAEFMRQDEGGTSTISADKNVFKVILDVQQFKPEEINVKLVDQYVMVEAKHEEKRDEHGLISRQFVRKYLLPEQVDLDKLSSNISSDGVLTIMAPLKQTEEGKQNERTIKIELTGKPALRGDTQKTTTTTQKPTTEEGQNREETAENENSLPEEKPEK